MDITVNAELWDILAGATSRVQWCNLLETALGNQRRLIAKKDGVTFRNCALNGPFVTDSEYAITSMGKTSNVTVANAVTLNTGTSVLRIEGNGHVMEGTLGLAGSGCAFTLPSNPTTSNSFAFKNLSITPPASLPKTDVEALPISVEGLSVEFGEAGNLQALTIAEQVYADVSIGVSGSGAQSRWRCTPISVPAYQRVNSVESLTGNTITYHVFLGVDGNGRVDVWFFAEAAYDAAGTWSGGAPRVASNREFGKVGIRVLRDNVAQPLWDGSTNYTCDFQRATSIRWQSSVIPWNVTSSGIAALQATGKLMKHKSQNLLANSAPMDSYVDQLTYEPFKVFGSYDQTIYVGDMPRTASQGGERNSVGFVHEAMARMIAEVGTHGNEAYATVNRVKTLQNLAESAGQVAIAGGVISPVDYRLVDPGNDVNGPFVYSQTNGSSFIGKLLPQPGTSGSDKLNMAFDQAHLPNLVSYTAYQLCKDPYHLFLTQATAAAAVGFTTNTGYQRGTDGRKNLIANGEERAYWWGLKALVEAWAITPAGTMPAPFRSRDFFEEAITNTLVKIRTFINNTSTFGNKLMDRWGALQTLNPTTVSPAATFVGLHTLSMDYGNYTLCHIRRLGYTAMDDIIVWHGRNLKIRAGAGGNYFISELQPNVNMVAIIGAANTDTVIPYNTPAEYGTWHPLTASKHSGDYPFSEWYTARSGADGGNYTFQMAGALACYKYLSTLVTLDWNPDTELTAFQSRIKGPVGGETQFPKAYVKHYFEY